MLANLRAIARRLDKSSPTLNTTALVNEAYLQLAGAGFEANDREHFLALVARAMRQILIDHSRTRNARKRGSGQAPFSLDECMDAPLERPFALIQVDDALTALEAHDRQKAQLIEMRFFGGMTAEESAEVLGLPVQKVRGELRIAQAWLKRELDNRNPRPRADSKRPAKNTASSRISS